LVLFANYNYTNQVEEDEVGGHVVRMREKVNSCRLLAGKSEGRAPLGGTRHMWVDNIKMDLLEIGYGGVVWTGMAQDRYRWRALVNAVMSLRVL
jgi:hypothetical protein